MYYNAAWQLVEERIDENHSFETPADPIDPVNLDAGDDVMQYMWGLRYIDDLVARRHNNVGSEAPDVYNDTWYHLTDAQFSTVAVIDETARLDERVAYDPYGQARHQYLRDVDGDGDGNDTDDTDLIDDALDFDIGDAYYNVDADFDRDGDVDANDRMGLSSYTALDQGQISTTGNTFGYCGYVFNPETADYTVRNRHYNTTLGRWIERDPAGYVDGMSLYEYVRSAPTRGLDPSGLKDKEWRPVVTKAWDRWKTELAPPYVAIQTATTKLGRQAKSLDHSWQIGDRQYSTGRQWVTYEENVAAWPYDGGVLRGSTAWMFAEAAQWYGLSWHISKYVDKIKNHNHDHEGYDPSKLPGTIHRVKKYASTDAFGSAEVICDDQGHIRAHIVNESAKDDDKTRGIFNRKYLGAAVVFQDDLVNEKRLHLTVRRRTRVAGKYFTMSLVS